MSKLKTQRRGPLLASKPKSNAPPIVEAVNEQTYQGGFTSDPVVEAYRAEKKRQTKEFEIGQEHATKQNQDRVEGTTSVLKSWGWAASAASIVKHGITGVLQIVMAGNRRQRGRTMSV